jgi:L-alanine-DL-glutamate epimerase-like enolase superfamily enzyme
VFSLAGFRDVVHHRAADVLQPDATVCGGILECLEVASLAKAHDLAVVPHVGGLTAVGVAAGLHLSAAMEPELMEYDPDPYQPLRDELLVDPIFGMDRVVDGRLSVPSGPGLGIEIDEAVLAAYPYERGTLYQEVYPEHGAGRL